jgi:hypothetical protein
VGIAPEVDFTGFQASRLSLSQINDPQLGGPDGDADGDAEDNLSEFLSGTEPNDPASVVHTSRQLNISTRETVGTGEDVLIGGLIVSGLNGKAGDPARDRSFSRRFRAQRTCCRIPCSNFMTTRRPYFLERQLARHPRGRDRGDRASA